MSERSGPALSETTFGRGLVRWHPGQEAPTIDGLSYELPVGITAVPGRAASGMSTVAGLAGGAYLPNSGTVVVGGVDLTALGAVEHARWTAQHVRYLVHVARVPDGAAGRPIGSAWETCSLSERVCLVVAHEPTVFLAAPARDRARELLREMARRVPVLITNDAVLQSEAVGVIRLPPTPSHRPLRVNAWHLSDLGVPVVDEGGYALALPSEANGAFPRVEPRLVTPWVWRAVRRLYGRTFGLAAYASLQPGPVPGRPRRPARGRESTQEGPVR